MNNLRILISVKPIVKPNFLVSDQVHASCTHCAEYNMVYKQGIYVWESTTRIFSIIKVCWFQGHQFHLRSSLHMYSKVLDHLKQIVICREISLSVVSNMSKCIIKSIKFCIENSLIEFGIPELWKKIWFFPHTLSARFSCSYWVNWVNDGSNEGNDSQFDFRTNFISLSMHN